MNKQSKMQLFKFACRKLYKKLKKKMEISEKATYKISLELKYSYGDTEAEEEFSYPVFQSLAQHKGKWQWH